MSAHTTAPPTTVVIVPGLRGPVDDHWQTHLARRLDAVAVAPLDRPKTDLTGRVRDLQSLVEQVDGPLTLVAHSAGVHVVVHWARLHGARHGHRIRGALLATPPDLVDELPASYPSLGELTEAGWLPVPHDRLPFPSIVAASMDDPLADYWRVRALARAWGSRFVGLGPVGHLNPASGFGDWPFGDTLLARLHAETALSAAL